MRRTTCIILTLVLLVVSSFSFGFAASVHDSEIFTIEKFDDGRVKPSDQFVKLSENQIQLILLNIGFTEEEIETMPPNLKEVTARNGGKKVETTSENLSIFYYDVDGNKYEVNEDNFDYYMAKAKSESDSVEDLIVINSYDDGNLEVKSYVVYTGSSSTEHIYNYSTWYNYRDYHDTGHEHVLAIAWQYHTTRTGSNIFAEYNYYGTIYDALKSIGYASGGTSMKAYKVHAKYQYGQIIHEVRIPKAHSGQSGEIVYKYGWNTFPFTAGVNIGFLSISFSNFTGFAYEDTRNFTIHQ